MVFIFSNCNLVLPETGSGIDAILQECQGAVSCERFCTFVRIR